MAVLVAVCVHHVPFRSSSPHARRRTANLASHAATCLRARMKQMRTHILAKHTQQTTMLIRAGLASQSAQTHPPTHSPFSAHSLAGGRP
jgi:hypothetical protein